MPRIAISQAVPSAVSRRARKEKRAESPISFPPDATHWQIRNESKEKLSCFTDDGVEVFRFPIAEFTLGTIRGRWGGGRFTVFFVDKMGKSRGRNEIGIEGPPKKPGAPEVDAELVDDEPSAALTRTDPMTQAIGMLQAIKGIADKDAEKTIATQMAMIQSTNQTATELFRAAMGRDMQREAHVSAAMPAQLEVLLTKLVSKVDELAERVDDIDDPDPDGPDDDERRDMNGAPGFPEDWDGLGQFAYRVIARQMPALEKAAPELIKSFMLKVKEAQENQLRANAAAAAANGLAVAR